MGSTPVVIKGATNGLVTGTTTSTLALPAYSSSDTLLLAWASINYDLPNMTISGGVMNPIVANSGGAGNIYLFSIAPNAGATSIVLTSPSNYTYRWAIINAGNAAPASLGQGYTAVNGTAASYTTVTTITNFPQTPNPIRALGTEIVLSVCYLNIAGNVIGPPTDGTTEIVRAGNFYIGYKAVALQQTSTTLGPFPWTGSGTYSHQLGVVLRGKSDKISALQWNMSSQQTVDWYYPPGTLWTHNNNRLEISIAAAPSNYPIQTDTTYDLKDSSIQIEVAQRFASVNGSTLDLRLEFCRPFPGSLINKSAYMSWAFSNNLSCVERILSTSVTSTVDNNVYPLQRFGRIRESQGTLYFEASADRITWRTIKSVVHNMNDLHCGVSLWGRTTSATPVTGAFDNLNLPTPASFFAASA
jgi:hypothetical protein